MASRKHKPVQLDLFTTPSVDFENQVWEHFEKEVQKLHNDGFKSRCQTWWRSRFYETIICPNHQRNKKGFEFEQKAAQCWKFIWDRYELKMTHP